MSLDSYARQKTWQAVQCLISPSPFAIRLEYAATTLLPLRAHATEQDDELVKRIDAIIASLTKDHAVSLDQGCKALDEQNARRIADDILGLMLEAFGGL